MITMTAVANPCILIDEPPSEIKIWTWKMDKIKVINTNIAIVLTRVRHI